MMKRIFYYVLMSSCCMPAFAEQVKLAADNQTILAKIAAKELTHIYIDGDRVNQVRGLEGAYELKKDELQGSIYIQPMPNFQHRSFNLFITTELGHTYPLLLSAVDIPGENIKLKPITSAKKVAAHWETSSPYEQTLMKLMSAMVNEQRIEGYAVVAIGKVLSLNISTYKTVLHSRYLGKHLEGQILRITNTSDGTVKVNPQQFITRDTRAIGILSDTLMPQQTTTLYRVMNHE